MENITSQAKLQITSFTVPLCFKIRTLSTHFIYFRYGQIIQQKQCRFIIQVRTFRRVPDAAIGKYHF